MQVLIIDDDADSRDALHEMLISLQHVVVAEADNMSAAIDAYQRNRPDLVTLDVAMPDADGLTVLEALRKLDPKARVIVISGQTQRSILDALKKAGALGFVTKPFSLAELKATFGALA